MRSVSITRDVNFMATAMTTWSFAVAAPPEIERPTGVFWGSYRNNEDLVDSGASGSSSVPGNLDGFTLHGPYWNFLTDRIDSPTPDMEGPKLAMPLNDAGGRKVMFESGPAGIGALATLESSPPSITEPASFVHPAGSPTAGLPVRLDDGVTLASRLVRSTAAFGPLLPPRPAWPMGSQSPKFHSSRPSPILVIPNCGRPRCQMPPVAGHAIACRPLNRQLLNFETNPT